MATYDFPFLHAARTAVMRSLSPQSDAPDVDTPRVRARTPRAAPASVTGASQSSGDISWDSVALGLPPHPGEPTASHISYDSTPPRTMEVGVGASSSTAPPGSTTSFEAALSAAMAPSQPASTHPKQGSHQASHESHSQVSGTEATSSALAASLSHLRAAQSAEAQLRGQIATNDALYRQLQQEHAQLQAAMAAMTSVSGSSVASSAHLAGQGPQTASSVSAPTPPPPPGMSPLRPAPPSDGDTPEHLRGVHSVAEEQSDDASSFSEHSLSPGPDSCSSSSCHRHGGHEGGSPDTEGDTPESQHYAPLSFFQDTASQARSGQYAGQELLQDTASQARSGQYAGQELLQGAASQARSGQYAGQELLQDTASQARSGQYAGQELLQGSDATVDVGVGLRSLGGRPATYRASQHASYPPMHTASHSLGSPVPALRGGPTVRSTRQAHPSGQPGSPGIQYLLKKYGEQQRRTVVHSEQPAREGGPDGEEAEGGVQGGATRAVSPIAAALGPRVDAHAARALSHSAREAAEEAVAAAARSRAAAQAVAMVGAQGHDETVSTQTDSTDRTSALSASPVPEEVGPQAGAGAAGACGSHDAAGDIPSRLVPRPRQAFVPWPHPHYEWYNVRYDGQGRRQRLAACVRPWEAPHHSSAQQESKGGDTAGAGVPAPGHMDVSDAVQGGVVSLASYRDAVRTAEGLYLTMRSAGLQPDVRSSTGGKAPTTRERIRRDRALHCKRVRGARPSQRDQRCLASKNTQAVHALRAALQCIEDPLVDVPAPLPMPSKGGDEVGPPLHLGDLLAPSDGGQWRQQVAVAAASNPSPAAALKVNALHGAVEATKNPRELAHALATVLQEMCVEVGAQQVSEALPCLRKMAKASLLYPPLKRYANVVCDVVGAKLVAHDPDTGIPPVGLEESLYLLRDALGGHGH